MAAVQQEVLFVHHSDGYNNLSQIQQIQQKCVSPHVTAAAGLLNEDRAEASFVVVDYGAADGLNSVPMIAQCADELSSTASGFEWIFNDLSHSNNKVDVHRVQECLNELSGWKEGLVKLRYVDGNFYTQVVPDNSVDLGVSVAALNWLSQRPPRGSGLDPGNPDEATRAISARDWADFLQCRSKELKQGGRLVIAFPATGHGEDKDKSHNKDFSVLFATVQQVIYDMFNERRITEEEYESARVFTFALRTDAELRAPFVDPDLCHGLRLVDLNTYDLPCPCYHIWMEAGGRQDKTATDEYVSAIVKFLKSFANSFWKILEVKRSRDVHLSIIHEYYKRVEERVRENPEGHHLRNTVSVVDIIKE